MRPCRPSSSPFTRLSACRIPTAIGACIALLPFLAVPAKADPGFQLGPTGTTLTVPQGGYAGEPISVVPSGGFSGAVSLSVSGAPAGVKTWVNPTVTVGGPLQVHVTSAPVGSYTLTVTGTSGALSAQTAVTLSVTPAPSSSTPALRFTDFVASAGAAFPDTLKLTYTYRDDSASRPNWSETVRYARATSLSQLPGYGGGSQAETGYAYSQFNSGGGSHGVILDAPFQYATTYYYRAIQRVIYQDTSQPQPYPFVTYYTQLGTIEVVPMKAPASEDQAVDSRLDPRYSAVHRLDHAFGTTVYRGGLFAGYFSDPAKVGRSFVKFALPPPAASGVWQGGGLYLYYTRSADTGTTTVGAQRAGNDWSAQGLTWDTAPALGSPSAGASTALVYDKATPSNTPPGWVRLTPTEDILMAAATGGPLSFGLASADETSSGWAYFAKAEYQLSLDPCLLYALGGPI